MSSGKPQTRGLAALLRIERERRALEETGADALSDAVSTGGEAVSSEPVSPLRDRATGSGQEMPSGVGERPGFPSKEAPESAGEEVSATTALTRQSDTAPAGASSESAEPPPAIAEPPARAVASPPRPRPAPARAPRRSANRTSESTLVDDPGWEKFVADWKPFLREGVKFKLCEFFYRNTAAVGSREFITSTAQLSRVSGAHRRHIFLVLRQLEELRFIRKESLETNRKDEGLVIRFFPDRQS